MHVRERLKSFLKREKISFYHRFWHYFRVMPYSHLENDKSHFYDQELLEDYYTQAIQAKDVFYNQHTRTYRWIDGIFFNFFMDDG